jgi:tetratricopeptide (TPR) repeat protein
MHQGEVEAARRYYEESLALRRELGDPRGVAWSLNGLGRVAQRQGDFQAAQQYHEESLTIRRELGDQRGIADCLEELAQAAGGQGQPERAVRLFGAAHALRHALGAPLSPPEQPRQEEQLAALRTALGDAAFRTAWEAGQGMTRE